MILSLLHLTHNINTIKLHYTHKSEHNELDGHTSAWPGTR